MNINGEVFAYRLPVSTAGTRPGAHRGLSRGSGMSFAAHARLFDLPDPRRLDLRASINDVRGDWLVRTYLQPASINIHVLVDMSASMQFGQPGKLRVATDFLQSLGISAHAYGDAISLLPFDDTFREDLFQPPRRGGAVGAHMAKTLLEAKTVKSRGTSNIHTALENVISRLEGQSGMVFVLSDFHWALNHIEPLLAKLANATLVPIVIWDQAEVTPPDAGQLLFARDLESGHKRQLWINESKREQWLSNVEAQRQQLVDLFAQHNSSPFFIEHTFIAERLSRYFMEHVS